MRLGSSFTVALRALARNPGRAALTMLGIIIGIAAVITLMELGAGSAESIRSNIETMGASTILVFPGAARSGGISMGSGTSMSLTPDDYQALLRRCPHVEAAVPIVNARGQVIFENQNWTPNSMVGTAPEYLDVRGWTMEEGEMFNDRQVQSSATVCVVGKTIVRELFNGRSPLGSEIRIKNVNFRVIGVLASKGANMMGFDQDDVIIAPWTTIRQRVAGSRTSSGTSSTSEISTNSVYPGDSSLYPPQSEKFEENYRWSPRFVYVDQILLKAYSPDEASKAMDEIEAVLRERHRLEPGMENDFRLRSSAEMLKMLTETTTLMTNLLLGVALLSLVVGGVGIMNIMLVSVTERTREIGLRMAVGARARDILRQFLIESIVLCLAGGLIGILLGHGAALFLRYYLGWPVIGSVQAVLAAMTVSASVGIVFGFYPAWKASRLDPIDALRYE